MILGEGFPVASQFNVKLDPSNSYYLALKIDEYSLETREGSEVEMWNGISQFEFHMGKSLLLWFNKLKYVVCSI